MPIISRYVLEQFLRWFVLCIAAAGGVFLIVDFFLDVEDFAGGNANFAVVAWYFLLKLPKILIEVYPAGALLAVLVSLGILADHRELLALRACGVESRKLAVPLVGAGIFLSVGAFLWNEVVVPPTSTRARIVKDIDIEAKQRAGNLDAVALWFQGDAGFFNINYFDANRNVLHGITVHELDPTFRLARVFEAPTAYWNGESWDVPEGTVTDFRAGATGIPRAMTANELVIDDTPQEFRRKRRRSYEFDYRELSQQVELLQQKGLDASEYLVDLYFKQALPFSGLVGVALGFSLILRTSRRASLAYNLGLAMVVVFAYWATMAVTVSAGHAGNLPPIVAAWSANVLFLAIAGVIYATARD
jgi:lipopolysaccharide export system permease protein